MSKRLYKDLEKLSETQETEIDKDAVRQIIDDIPDLHNIIYILIIDYYITHEGSRKNTYSGKKANKIPFPYEVQDLEGRKKKNIPIDLLFRTNILPPQLQTIIWSFLSYLTQ